MNDPLLVRRFERLGGLMRDEKRFIERQGAARDSLRQILALDELHDQRPDAAAFLEAIQVRDVGMVQRREGLRFAREPGEPIGIVGEDLGKDLQRHVTIQPGVAGPEHLSHPAFADRSGDFVDAETGAGIESQVLELYVPGNRRTGERERFNGLPSLFLLLNPSLSPQDPIAFVNRSAYARLQRRRVPPCRKTTNSP